MRVIESKTIQGCDPVAYARAVRCLYHSTLIANGGNLNSKTSHCHCWATSTSTRMMRPVYANIQANYDVTHHQSFQLLPQPHSTVLFVAHNIGVSTLKRTVHDESTRLFILASHFQIMEIEHIGGKETRLP